MRITSTPRLDEARPVAGGGYLAWARDSLAHPERYATYVRRARGRLVRVNPPGTQAWPGAISGHTLVYQETGKGVRGGSDVRLFDLRRKQRYNPPRGVNTGAWEGHPSLSGNWLLFLRVDGETGRWLLRHLRTGEMIAPEREITPGCASVLELLDARIGAGQVNGGWAAYQGCAVPRRYDLDRRRKAAFEFGGVAAVVWRSPSVARDGTLHYVSFSRVFGPSAVGLERRPPRDNPRIPYEDILVLPPGEMIRSTYVSGDTIYFDRQTSRDAPADVYRIDP